MATPNMLHSKASAGGVSGASPARTWLAIAAAAAFGAVSYRYLYRLGFDWGDMGSYAQIARELAAGSSPADYVGYGPLWHFIGVWIFQIFGVNFGALLIAFHLIIIACAVLILLSLRTATGLLWPGLVVALAIICVPPFQASTMRLLTLALFAWPFFLVARTSADRDMTAVLAAAAAIGLNFVLRPDYAYLYSAVLGAFLLWRALAMDAGPAGKAAYLARRALGGAVAAALALTPVAIDAVLRGYWPKLLSETLSYPRRFLVILGFGDGGASGAAKLSYLRMPPIAAILDPAGGQQVFALLIYSTLAGLAATAVLLVWRTLRRKDRAENEALLAALLLAASQWPHFAVFRPSWVHFASFMHGYLILAACLLAWLPWLVAPGRGLARTARVLLAGQIALFVAYGALVGETGVAAKLAGRTEVFEGRNGVRVVVSPGEKRIFDNVAGIIERNSRPGDRIVCVPYCAGFSFMTGRQPLFAEHYVDDSTPVYRPGWIERAIALTEAARPPVVIVLDWAPNGSDASRFDVWASRYVDHLRRTYPVSGRFEMGTVWLRDAPDRAPATTVAVLDYGPKLVRAGEIFNRQPNGDSALWMKLSADPGPGAVIRLDGRDLVTVVAGDAVTALVPADALAVAGRRMLQVVDPLRNLESPAVPLEVSQP